METLVISLKNEKAKQLLNDLAALDLIEIKEEQTISASIKLSQLKNQINGRMNEAEIDEQLQTIRRRRLCEASSLRTLILSPPATNKNTNQLNN